MWDQLQDTRNIISTLGSPENGPKIVKFQGVGSLGLDTLVTKVFKNLRLLKLTWSGPI